MSKNQSQETSKGQGDGATEGVQGTAGAPVAVSAEAGASHVSSKGTPGLSDCIKSSDANLRESRGGTSVSKITLLTFCGQREPRGAPG